MAGTWGDAGPAYLEATEHAAALVEVVEDELVIRAVNRALADLLGDAPETFVDQPAARSYPAAELADVHAKVTTALSDAEPLTYEAVRDLAQGRLVILGRVLPLDGSRALIVGSDISRERTAEDRLEASRRRQAQAMELNDDIVQELSRAWVALELEDVPTARQAVEATTRRVQDIVSGLLEATSVADGAVEPGSLVRQRPADGAFAEGSAQGRRAHDRRDDRALLGPSGRSPT